MPILSRDSWRHSGQSNVSNVAHAHLNDGGLENWNTKVDRFRPWHPPQSDSNSESILESEMKPHDRSDLS